MVLLVSPAKDRHVAVTRLAQARRPFLTAEWRHLVMLNYEVERAVLRPLVPAGTALDLWQDRALVSVVGFKFLSTRVLGVAVPFHRDFEEVNLRFYVRHDVPGAEARRGVVFVRELVPRAAIANLARLAYNEPYRAVPMRSVVPAGRVDTPGRLTYEWRTGGAWQSLAATATGAPAVPEPGSENAFITEHHWGYTRQRDGSTVEYEVTNPVWRVGRGSGSRRRRGRAVRPGVRPCPRATIGLGSDRRRLTGRRLSAPSGGLT